jgi:hypothetical protein
VPAKSKALDFGYDITSALLAYISKTGFDKLFFRMTNPDYTSLLSSRLAVSLFFENHSQHENSRILMAE